MQITNLAADAESFTSNAFLVDDVALVDTGADPVILDQAPETLDTVVITHSHPDHVENLPQIVAQHDVAVHAHAPGRIPVDAERLADEDTVMLAGTAFTAYHTPGHRDDHICLYSPDEKILFAGDLIFPGGSFGRTDLDEGDRERLIASIERITELDVKAMYAGHDEPTTDSVNTQIKDSLVAAKQREPKYG